MSKNSVVWPQTVRTMATVATALLIAGTWAARAEDVEKPWDRSIALGLTLARGNSHSEQLNAAVTGNKIWATDELRLGVDGSYGITDGTKSTEQLHGGFQYKHLFTPRFYGTIVNDDLHDTIAGIEYRVTIGPGLGYYFIKSDENKLNAEAGPSVVFQRTQEGTPPTLTDTTYLAARVAERYDHQFSATAKLWQTAEFLPRVDDYQDYLLNIEVGVEAAITKAFSVRVVADDRYDNRPSVGRKHNDILLVSALAYKF